MDFIVYSMWFDAVKIDLSASLPCVLAWPSSVQSIMLRIGLIASLFILYGQSQAPKPCEIKEVMKKGQ